MRLHEIDKLAFEHVLSELSEDEALAIGSYVGELNKQVKEYQEVLRKISTVNTSYSRIIKRYAKQMRLELEDLVYKLSEELKSLQVAVMEKIIQLMFNSIMELRFMVHKLRSIKISINKGRVSMELEDLVYKLSEELKSLQEENEQLKEERDKFKNAYANNIEESKWF